MRFQKGHFIQLPEGYRVSVPNRSIPEAEHFTMTPTGLYITHDSKTAWIHYAGDQADESHAVFKIPSDPAFIRKLSRELSKFAKSLEEENKR